MVAAFIFVLSIVAVMEFAVAQWRSMWIAVGSQPLSDGFQNATGLAPNAIGADHFDLLARTSERLPLTSTRESNVWLREVRLYYNIMCGIEIAFAKAVPALSSWAAGELISCARYAAAVLDQRLTANLEYAADVRAF